MCYVPSLNTGWVHEGDEDLNINVRGERQLCVHGGVGNVLEGLAISNTKLPAIGWPCC